MKVSLIQQAYAGTREEMVSRTLAAIEAEKGADLVVLQELHTGPYFCQTEDPAYFDWAESIPDGPSCARFSEAARSAGVVLVTSLFERRMAGVYHNTAVVFDRDGSCCGSYRKMHIPEDPGFYEKFYFTPGDLGFTPIQTSLGRLGVLVCWDQWYPEAARLMALAGADILIYPTAIGWVPDDDEPERLRQREAWITSMRGHAIANALPVVAVNRVGHEPDPSGATTGILFYGSSFVAGPQGEIIASAPDDREATLRVELDLARTEAVRRLWPFLRDRRVDAYGDIVRRVVD
jgi:N-carbamoylputrescine amidase